MSPHDFPTPYSYTTLYSLISKQQNKSEHVSLHYRASSSFPYFYCVSSVSLSLSLFLFLLMHSASQLSLAFCLLQVSTSLFWIL
ncbi:hypothetical protein E4T47_09377 [Aureobasidium subglaciale]|nr:hypothetical protein E4T47_09377 [Aureobasidium subglaciale]